MQPQQSVTVSAAENRVTWRLQDPPVTIRDLTLGENSISLAAKAEAGGGIVIVVDAQQPFELEVETEFARFSEQVPAGRTRYLLTYLDRTDVRKL